MIDGSRFEGGGQIARTALALSTITDKPFSMNNIRKGRKVPGLKAQHMHCIKALEQLSPSSSDHSGIGATELDFTPGKIKGGKIEVDIGTAGSITLLLQSLILPCLLAEKRTTIIVKGGTDVKWSPSIDYFTNVFIPSIEQYAEKITVKVKERGYYPKGQGVVECTIVPRLTYETKKEAFPLNIMDVGKIIQIKGISHASNSLADAQVAERQARSAEHSLNRLGVPVSISIEYRKAASLGSGITLWAVFEDEHIVGADELGEKRKKAEEVGSLAASQLLKAIQDPVDYHLADQLIPFVALFGGSLQLGNISGHVRANAYVCEYFLGDVLHIDDEKRIVSQR